MTDSDQKNLDILHNVNNNIDKDMSSVIDDIIMLIMKWRYTPLTQTEHERLDNLNSKLKYLNDRRLVICKLMDIITHI